MLDFTYACRGCDRRFSLLVGDPKAEICPDCSRDLCGEVASEISAALLADLGRRNGEVPVPEQQDPEALCGELVGALLDVQDALSTRAPAGHRCRPEDAPMYRRVLEALGKAAARRPGGVIGRLYPYNPRGLRP